MGILAALFLSKNIMKPALNATYQLYTSMNFSDYPQSQNGFITKETISNDVIEIRHIGFLKVHKAGSSTMQNIFFRFGLKRNLTFAIPRKSNYFKFKTILPVKQGGHYDILAFHAKLNFKKSDFDAILPEDKVNIAIIREPLKRMISAAYYYRNFGSRYLKTIPKDNFISELIENPEKYEPGTFSNTRNSMAKDFGFSAKMKATEKGKIQKTLKLLDKEFKLVLLVERFDESLVLMKRILGWKMSDILYIPSKTKHHPIVNVTNAQRRKHEKTCFLDYAIYGYFSKVFDAKVMREGQMFELEVAHFKLLLQKTWDFCDDVQSKYEVLNFTSSPWHSPFEISPDDCELMRMKAVRFQRNLRERHIRMNGLNVDQLVDNEHIAKHSEQNQRRNHGRRLGNTRKTSRNMN